ncbi:redoxin domain-containing protein [bacterium]|nr:MAG: redoxin domain-containing protein [bacterium]
MKKWTTFAAVAILGAGASSIALRGQTPIAQAAEATTVSFDKKVAAFSLPDPAGKSTLVGDWAKSKATVLLFVATKCPVSNDYNTRMASLAKAYSGKGVKFVGINSNKAELGPEVAAHTKENGFDFVVLKDPQNKIADRFDAKVTPEAYVIGPKGDLLYHGRIDNSQQEAEVKDKSLAVALDSILAGKPVAEKETRAFGCSIKREG